MVRATDLLDAFEALVGSWRSEAERFREAGAAKACRKCLVAAETYELCALDAEELKKAFAQELEAGTAGRHAAG